MKRSPSFTAIAVATMFAGAALPAAQGPAASPSSPAFEVVSVKRVAAGAPPTMIMGVPPGQMAVRAGGRFAASWVTVRDLVRTAYGILDVQVVGGPSWIGSDRFDVEATTRPDVSAEETRAMLRALLQHRFNLAAHTENRTMTVSALESLREDGRLGPQLRRSGPACAPPTPPSFLPGVPPPPPPPPGAGRSLILGAAPMRCPSMALIGHMSMREITMADFAIRLVPVVGRLVINRTTLSGTYDLDLTYAPDPGAEPLRVNGAAITIDAPALPAAIRDQLGLRLETSKAPVDVVVLDRVDAPTVN